MRAARSLTALILFSLSLSLLAGCEGPQSAAALSFEDGRVRLPVPGTDKAVGYFTVTNRSDTPVVLTGARAEGVRAIEFHTMIRDGDMMRMRRLDNLAIAPKETVRFESGGKHLMLFGVENSPEAVTLTFTEADGTEHSYRFETFDATK